MRFTKADIAAGVTVYSERIPGARGNYRWSVNVSVTAPGFVRIEQRDETGQITDAVLLSPKQWREIAAFVESDRRRVVA